MPLDTEVGLVPGDIVLNGDPAPIKKGTSPLVFGSCLLWPNGRPSQLLPSSCYIHFTTRRICIALLVSGRYLDSHNLDSQNLDTQNRVRARVRVRVRVSYDCRVYDYPDFDWCLSCDKPGFLSNGRMDLAAG